MAALHREKEKRRMIILIYVIGVGLSIFYLLFPQTFLLPSVPKMYFPNYYVPGNFYWISRVIFQIIVPLYFVYELIRTYRHSPDYIEKNRILYFTISLSLGWFFGVIPVLLIYNVLIDPAWGIFSAILFLLPFSYAVVRYELLDIKIVAKRAFVYGISVAVVGSVIVLSDSLNQSIESLYPGFPFWLMPIVLAFIAVALGVLVWGKLRDNDILKYEFITTVTHKFRTPLTHIKWASENLSKSALSPEDLTQIGYIESADDKLVELTGLLMNVSGTEDSGYQYHMSRGDLSALAEEVASSVAEQSFIKKIQVFKDIQPGIYATFDESRIHFIIQTFIENAVHYTPEGGNISISVHRAGKKVLFSVKDSGIGIARDELPRLFTKFYRGYQARLADTEGMGIGLYMSKNIILRHGGKIWGESDGHDKGSTFSFSLKTVE
jgi:signal transduction histidine kinase